MKKFFVFLLVFSIFLLFPGILLTGCEEEPKYCTVTYCDENGEVLEYVTVLRWDKAEYSGEDPTKAESEGYIYTFSDWVNKEGKVVNLSSVDRSVKLYPRFHATAKLFKITIPERVVVMRTNGDALVDGDFVFYDEVLTISCNVSDGKALQYLRANTTELKNGQYYTIKGDTIISFTEKNAVANINYGTYIYMYKIGLNGLKNVVSDENLVTFINITEQHFSFGTNDAGFTNGENYVLYTDIDYTANGNSLEAEIGNDTMTVTLADDGQLYTQFVDCTAYFVYSEEFDDLFLDGKTYMDQEQCLKLTFDTTAKTIYYDSFKTIYEDRDEDGEDEEYEEPLQVDLEYRVFGDIVVGFSNDAVVLVGQAAYKELNVNNHILDALYLRIDNVELMLTQSDWGVFEG